MSEETTWAVQEVRDELKRQNAILAALLNEVQNANRDDREKAVSLSSTETRIDSMEHTLYDQE